MWGPWRQGRSSVKLASRSDPPFAEPRRPDSLRGKGPPTYLNSSFPFPNHGWGRIPLGSVSRPSAFRRTAPPGMILPSGGGRTPRPPSRGPPPVNIHTIFRRIPTGGARTIRLPSRGPPWVRMHMYFEAPPADPQGARGQWEIGPMFRPSQRVRSGRKRDAVTPRAGLSRCLPGDQPLRLV